MHYGGAVLIAAGLVIRWSAIRTLGRFFTVKVTVREGHRVVKEGLYRHVRHPSYSGALLAFVGLAVSFASWATLLVILVPVFAAMGYRIHVEEQALAAGLGEEYRAYQRETRRLVPGVY
jgi:protein-S-isoprenylcysteine O-methyltransferase Ste14